MNLVTLKLRNFCHHRSLDVEFTPGVNGIVGANGSGKSTITQGLRFAVLGSSGNAGAKVDDLNWDAAAAGEGGSVEWVFEKDNVSGKLNRAIHRAAASLAWGDVKARSVSAVNAEIMKLTGESQRTLEDIIFVMQGSIYKVLFETPAERKKSFHSLFGIDKTEEIRELLRKELSAAAADPNDARIDQLNEQLKIDIDPALKNMLGEVNRLNAELTRIDHKKHQQLVDLFNEGQKAAQRQSELKEQLQSLEGMAAEEAALQVQLQQQFSELSNKVKTDKEHIDACRSQLGSLQSSKKVHDTIVSQQAKLAEAQAALNEPNPTPPGTTQADIDAAEAEVSRTRIELAPKQVFVDTFKNADGAVNCPTCLQPVEGAPERAAQLEAELTEQHGKLAGIDIILKRSKEALRQYDLQKQQHATRVESARASVTELQTSLESLGEDTFVEGSTTELESAIQAFEQMEGTCEKCRQDLEKISQEAERSAGRIGGLRDQIESLQPTIDSAPTAEAYQESAGLVKQYNEGSLSLSNLNGQLSQLQKRRSDTLRELERLKESVENAEAMKKYHEMCERARSLFHHDCLPQVATQAYLKSLNVSLNKYLETFQVPFSCEISSDLTVLCQFPAGMKPADRLSGGQKVMLGIAFRFAIYDMFASDLGFMVLDEPTNTLDPDKVDAVVQVLQSVRRHAHNTGMQLLIVTHRPELEAAFDNTIRL